MTPRRLATLVAVACVVLLVTLVTINRIQRQTFAHILITDVATIDTWSVEGHGTRVENGFECFVARTRQLTPDELKRVSKLAANLDSLSDAGTLMTWAADSRHCVDAKYFAPVDGLRSYSVFTENAFYDSALYRLSALQAEQELGEGLVDEAAETCVEIGEHIVSRSHLSLLANLMGAMGARTLSTPCARAWGQMSASTRQWLMARIDGLPLALAPNAEWLRIERITMELIAYGEALTGDELSQVPVIGLPFSPLGLARFTAPTAWARSRRRFDALLLLADTPGDARRAASAALDEADETWLLGHGEGAQSPDYERMLVRRDDSKRVLVLLADIAAHRTLTLPTGARIEDGGVIWPLDGDHSLFFPIPEPHDAR